MKLRSILALCTILVFAFAAEAQTGEVKFSKSAKAADGSVEFNSGEFIYAHIAFPQAISGMLTLNERPVTLVAEFYSKGKMLEEDMFGFDTAAVRGSKQTSIVIPVVSDPAGDVPSFGKNLFSTRLPAELAKLPEGRHEIELQLKSYNFKDATEVMAKGTFTLVIAGGARAWYQKNGNEAFEAMAKRGVTSVNVSARDAAMGVVGGTSVITLVNNCGRSVWMRKASGSDKTEYRLSPGQTMRYDRDGGYLEEWNFGTKRWTTVTKVWSPGPDGKANICQK